MQRKTSYGVDIPDDLVPVGHVAGAFGVQGWIRIHPYSAHADAMLESRRWWVDKPEMSDIERRQAKWHGDEIIAQLVGITDRNAAEALKGAVVHISRRYFPPLEENEYYWVDLIGLSVVNLQGERLGSVIGLMESGAHPILRVTPDASGDESRPREILIPFVDQFVKTIDQPTKLITVDWQRDY